MLIILFLTFSWIIMDFIWNKLLLRFENAYGDIDYLSEYVRVFQSWTLERV